MTLSLSLDFILPKSLSIKLLNKMSLSLIRHLILGILPQISLSSLLRKTASLLQKSRLIEKSPLNILYQEKLSGCSKMSLLNSFSNTSSIKPDLFTIRMLYCLFTLFNPALRIPPDYSLHSS